MTLSAPERQALGRIADEIAASDPNLASLLGVFNRLTSGEAMPQLRRAGGSQQREARYSYRIQGRTWKRRRQRRRQRRTVGAWPLVAVSYLLSAALITVLIVLSHIGHAVSGRQACVPMWPATCTRPDAQSVRAGHGASGAGANSRHQQYSPPARPGRRLTR